MHKIVVELQLPGDSSVCRIWAPSCFSSLLGKYWWDLCAVSHPVLWTVIFETLPFPTLLLHKQTDLLKVP